MQLLVEAAKEISRSLTDGGIPHLVLGGVAVYLHGVERRDGDDIDILVGKANQSTALALISRLDFDRSGKYYRREQIKVQIKSKGFSSYPSPESEDECLHIDGVRVPTIDKMIQIKAEACRDILDKVLSEGIGGPSRRNSLMKHFTDLTGLVRVYGQNQKTRKRPKSERVAAPDR